MAKKNQEVIKALKKLAEDIDNVGLNDSDAWQRISGEFENAIVSVPVKEEKLKVLLTLVFQGFEHMGNQTANDPLALVDAIWQGLNAVEQCLTAQPDHKKLIDE